MEQFLVETHRVRNNNDGTVYYELTPTNIELKDMLLHGHDDLIVGTIEGTIATETIIHRVEMFDVLETYYPDIAANYYL